MGSVSIDGVTHALSSPHFVVATQNPLEHHGVHPLPESQLDRFLLHVRIGYPDAESERKVLQLVREQAAGTRDASFASVAQETVLAARCQVLDVHLIPALEEFLLQVVFATRSPGIYGQDRELIAVLDLVITLDCVQGQGLGQPFERMRAKFR